MEILKKLHLPKVQLSRESWLHLPCHFCIKLLGPGASRWPAEGFVNGKDFGSRNIGVNLAYWRGTSIEMPARGKLCRRNHGYSRHPREEGPLAGKLADPG